MHGVEHKSGLLAVGLVISLIISSGCVGTERRSANNPVTSASNGSSTGLAPGSETRSEASSETRPETSLANSSTPRGRVFSTDATLTDPAWTAAELAKPIAVRRLQATQHTSINIIRLDGAEQPHIHRDHDLIVIVLHGTARLHLGNHVMEVRSGDIMEIPRGVVHWAENTGSEASEVYAIFSPPYDGLDNIPVPPVPLPPP